MADQDNQPIAPRKVSKKTMGVVAGAAVVLILVTIVGTILFVRHFSASTQSTPDKPLVLPAMYMTLTPNFIVNFNVDGRQRYLQAEISLQFRDPALEQQLALHLPAIRNSIVMLLNKQVFADLYTVKGKDALRQEILTAITNILKTEYQLLSAKNPDAVAPAEIEQVLLTNFVMQ